MAGKGKGPNFGEGLVEGLREAVAWKRGEVALEVVDIDPMRPSSTETCRRSSGPSSDRCGGSQRHPSRRIR
jgi:putative transcriptional regulator